MDVERTAIEGWMGLITWRVLLLLWLFFRAFPPGEKGARGSGEGRARRVSVYQRRARDIRRGCGQADHGANCLLALGIKGAVGRGEVEGFLPLGLGEYGRQRLLAGRCVVVVEGMGVG